MKLEDQVCQLGQSIELFNYGITNSLFVHVTTKEGNYIGVKPADDEGISLHRQMVLPAFTVAELGQMWGSENYSVRDGSPTSEYANWSWYNDGNDVGSGPFATEAAARAHRLIRLLESGEITPDEVNSRLQ